MGEIFRKLGIFLSSLSLFYTVGINLLVFDCLATGDLPNIFSPPGVYLLPQVGNTVGKVNLFTGDLIVSHRLVTLPGRT